MTCKRQTWKTNTPVFKKKNYFWLRWVFIAVLGLPVGAESGGSSSLWRWASHFGGFPLLQGLE